MIAQVAADRAQEPAVPAPDPDAVLVCSEGDVFVVRAEGDGVEGPAGLGRVLFRGWLERSQEPAASVPDLKRAFGAVGQVCREYLAVGTEGQVVQSALRLDDDLAGERGNAAAKKNKADTDANDGHGSHDFLLNNESNSGPDPTHDGPTWRCLQRSFACVHTGPVELSISILSLIYSA